MATLNTLKLALRQEASAFSSPRQPLTDAQYSIGFETLMRESGWITYRDFIIPQLTQLLTPFLESQTSISVLEIGPGPKSVLGQLPRVLRDIIRRYTAFEPNELFAIRMEEWLYRTSGTESPLPCLERRATIHRMPFSLSETVTGIDKFDVILFCHSMYGMNPKVTIMQRALGMLVDQPKHGIVVVLHRDGSLHFEGLVCHRTASFPTGTVSVADDNQELDRFTSFVAGFTLEDIKKYRALRIAWQKVCRALGRRDKSYPGQLFFSSPDIMTTFTRHATGLPELVIQMPLLEGARVVKNREAVSHHPAFIVRPKEIRHIQECVQWALRHRVGLTITGGGHSGHCRWPNVVAVDMSAFAEVHILTAGHCGEGSGSDSGPLIIAEAGCMTGDIIHKAMEVGLTVPLGSRPSVGAGVWLQGGIGHLARLYGLSCDAIVGAVIISVENGQILCIGNVPVHHRPASAICPTNEAELLWAIRGAGTNFGIVVSVVFKAYPALTKSVRNWVIPLSDKNEAGPKFNYLDHFVAQKLSEDCSLDLYMYFDKGKLHLGVALFENPTAQSTSIAAFIGRTLGPENSSKTVDGVGLFGADMYIAEMHGGHGGNKTSSFKRCIFLKDIGDIRIVNKLIKAMETRPTPLSYLHLLQGGGAVRSIAAHATAFGYRDWDFACVITGVWHRDQDETELARSVVDWVYNLATELLPLSRGIYSADLGPDPRDATLAAKAFGPSRPHLARLKHILDPHDVLAYACPLRRFPIRQRLIVLVTGESGAGKDYCAEIWSANFNANTDRSLDARTVSISDLTKREYAAATPGVDLARLLNDRAYKERHRSALTAFFNDQLRRRPGLLEEHFLDVAYHAMNVDVLFITGMREPNLLAAYSHLVPECRLLEVRVQATKYTRQARRRFPEDGADADGDEVTVCDDCPSLIFNNENAGTDAVHKFAMDSLLPLFDEDIQRLANMVRPAPDFPRQGITFQHVLDIAQQPGGLKLCTRILGKFYVGDWTRVGAIVCPETGGFIFASSLAEQFDILLALIREAGKLPPPTIAVSKPTSHISSSTSGHAKESSLEMKLYLIPQGSSVVVVDDVLATGKTLCAALELLQESGIRKNDISVLVVAEFPVHRGRRLLRECGFGSVSVRSLLVFDGV